MMGAVWCTFDILPIMKPGFDYIGIGVGALITNYEGKIFLTLRGPKAKNERGLWAKPGGAVEFGETTQQALQREVMEEFGIEIKVREVLQVCNHILPHEHQHWISISYICEISKGKPQNKEPDKCSDMGWFTIEEAQKLPLSLVLQDDITALKLRKQSLI